MTQYDKRKRNNVVSFEELYEKGILSKHGLKEDSTFQNDFSTDIMLFYYVYGYTADEIAKMFDMNIATVYSYLSRGRKKLEKLLDGKKILIS